MPQRVSPSLVWKNAACCAHSATVSGQPRSLPNLALYSALRLRVLDQVLAQHQQQMVAVVDHHVELAVVVLLELQAVGDA